MLVYDLCLVWLGLEKKVSRGWVLHRGEVVKPVSGKCLAICLKKTMSGGGGRGCGKDG